MVTKTNDLKKEWLTAIDDVEKQLREEAAYFRELLFIYVNQLDKKDHLNNN